MLSKQTNLRSASVCTSACDSQVIYLPSPKSKIKQLKTQIKYIAAAIILTCLFGCSSESKQDKEGNDSAMVRNFLIDVTSLEGVESKTPIADFEKVARATADKIMDVTQSTINELITESANYKKCIIIAGDHTVVKIEDFSDCQKSTSWGACMPYAEGYIKKGDLVIQKDFMNNIIGRPDNQKRTAYLFK